MHPMPRSSLLALATLKSPYQGRHIKDNLAPRGNIPDCRGCSRQPAALQLLLIVLLTSGGLQTIRAQLTAQTSPLQGRGVPGPSVSDGIYISVFLDRLLGVNEHDYRFDAVLYAYVTWVDPAGVSQWFKNNLVTSCEDPARVDYSDEWCAEMRGICLEFKNSTNSAARARIKARGDAFLGADIALPCQAFDGRATRTSCSRPCSNGYTSGDCCDNIFIPDIQWMNIYSTNQDYTFQSQLTPQYDPDKAAYGAWMWSVSFHAEFFNRLSFRNFPFDHHKLLMQLRYTHTGQDTNKTSRLIPSAAGVLQLRPRAGGDDSSGWRVDRLYIEDFDPGPGLQQVRQPVSPPSPNDPVPLFATATVNGERVVTDLQSIFRQRLNSGNQLLVIIEVSRYSNYFVVNNVIPIVLSTLLGFFTYLIPASHIENRLGLLVTLFLALTALQFVISTNLPDSSYVLKSQALVLAGYAFFTAIALESWGVSSIARLHARHQRHKARKSAYKRHQSVVAASRATSKAAKSLCNLGRAQSGDVEQPNGDASDTDDAVESEKLETTVAASSQQPEGTPRLRRRGSAVQWVVAPAVDDPDYADWLAHQVDKWAIIGLLVSYIIVLVCILAI